MRRVLVWLLFLAFAAGAPCAVWFGREALFSKFEHQLTRETHEQATRAMVRMTVAVHGDDAARRSELADRIETFLAAAGAPPQRTLMTDTEQIESLAATLPPDRVEPAKAWIAAEAARLTRPVERRRMAPPPAAADPNSGRRGELSRDLASLKREQRGLEEDMRALAAQKEQVMEWRRKVRHPAQLIAEDPEALQMRQKLVDLELKLAHELEYLTPTHPQVQNLYTDIAQVKSSMDRRVMIAEDQKMGEIDAQVMAKQARRIALDGRIQKLSQQRNSMPAPAPAPAAAEPRDVPAPVAQSALQASIATEPFEVMAMEKRIQPNIDALAIAIAAAAALFAALGFVFGMGGAKPSTATEELPPLQPMAPAAPAARPAQITRPPPLTEKPKLPEPENKVSDKDMPGEPWIDLPKFPAVEKNLYTVFAPTSAAADFYQRSAVDMLDRIETSGRPALVCVASVQGGTGTSSLLANLAVPLAAQRPVVLIDLHLTAPKLHNIFSVPDTGDDITSDAPLDELAIHTPVENLRLAPLFSSESEAAAKKMKLKKRMEELMKTLPEDALVLADLAPLGRSEIYEELSSLSDAFLLVLGAAGLPAEQSKVLKKLAAKMKGKPVLRVQLTDKLQPGALEAVPPATYEFALAE